MIPGRAEKKRSQARPCRGSNTGQHDLQSYALPLSYRVRRLLTLLAFPYRDSLLMECTKLRSLKLSFLALQIQACLEQYHRLWKQSLFPNYSKPSLFCCSSPITPGHHTRLHSPQHDKCRLDHQLTIRPAHTRLQRATSSRYSGCTRK